MKTLANNFTWKGFKWLVGTMITVSVVVIIVVYSFSKQDARADETQQSKKQGPIPVKIASVTREKVAIPITAAGLVASSEESNLSFKTGGVIKRIFVDEGQSVKRGQLLAQLDLKEIQAQVNQARIALEKAERDMQRVEKLYLDTVVTLEQVQNSRSAHELAQANFDIAQFNLTHSSIYARENGKILRKLAENNEVIAAGRPVLALASTSGSWILKVALADKNVVKIGTDDKATITLDAYPARSLTGTVTQIENAPNQQTGLYEVEITFDEAFENLKTGFFAKAKITPSLQTEYTLVPIDALVEAEGQHATTFVPEANGKTKKVDLEIIKIMDGLVAVNSLESLEQVITEGVADLTEESVVSIY